MSSVSLFLIQKLYFKIWSFIFLSGTRFVSKANNLIIQKRYHRLLFFDVGKTFRSTDFTIQPLGDKVIPLIHIYSKQQST